VTNRFDQHVWINDIQESIAAFGGGGGSPPSLPQQPSAADPAVEKARKDALIAAQNARGRAQTLLTGGEGVTAAAPVQRKTLLGV
jgi:hypothetical protein